MKKTLLFAFAFAASVMALVSCGKDKKNDEPAVVPSNPLVGTWFYADTENDYFYTFQDNGVYQRIQDYYMNGRAVVAHEHIVGDGTYKTDGDVITANIVETNISMDGGPFGPFPDFWPAKEELKFKIEGDKLTLIRDFGTPEESKEVLTKGGKSDKPVDPEGVDVDPKKLVKTEWRTDSCFMNGQKTQPPHLYIEVLSEDAVLMNGENHNFTINGSKMTCTWFEGTTFTIVETKTGWAHVKGSNGSDVYLSKLPAKDIEDMIMEHQISDFVGTWKFAYYTYNNNNSNPPTHAAGTNPGVETWEFKADGSCIYKSWFSGETVTGTWECDPYMIKFTKNPAIGVITEDELITVQPLTPNWMSLYRQTNNQEYRWWFYRVE